MFFVLSKIFGYLILPLPLIFVFSIISFFLKRKRISRYLFVIASVLTIVFTNDFLANLSLKLLEGDPIPISELEHYKVGVVLTGLTRARDLPDSRVSFAEGVDRITDAVLLYRKGVIRKILVTGGSPLLKTDYNESEMLVNFLKLCRIPDPDIIIERKAQNTYQNALYTSELLKENGYSEKILLITSAFHIPRASSCFKKQNVNHDVFPTDFLTHPVSEISLDYFFPTHEALLKWNHFNKELFGMLVYKIMGYA
ncbi:MAG: YdcF family protein [Bacteroidota bacterium]